MNEHPSREIVIWMNQPSHYQSNFFHELASRPGVRLSVAYGGTIPQFRRDLGWVQNARPELYTETELRGFGDSLVFAWRHRRHAHMINGLWSVPVFIPCSIFLLVWGATVFFHSERPNPESERRGFWSCIKKMWVQVIFWRAAGIFVIGHRAAAFFKGMGVPQKKIIRFMYFTRPVERKEPDNHDVFTVGYVGQFIKRKRVEDLIKAFAALREELPHARLLLVGSGALKDSYIEQIGRLGLTRAVEMPGAYRPDEMGRAYYRTSVLVLPSKFDGWGLTVNEALQAGIPVICSDGCGAAELIEENPHWGLIYPVGDVAALAEALKSIAIGGRAAKVAIGEVIQKIGVPAQTDRFLAALERDTQKI